MCGVSMKNTVSCIYTVVPTSMKEAGSTSMLYVGISPYLSRLQSYSNR